ncbi:class I SAM-dependent methyltransferase [Geobacillus stearothermophilus]|uniref:class I SAM-dependent methyltransferase n=1 Tax=Geobacillus stearothermophilus TaxID=1422 RepID=UPI003D216CCF
MKYNIKIDMNVENSQTLILKNIKPNSIVLEFGPASGYMTEYMKKALNCKVYGVEIDPHFAEKAKKFAEEVIVGDIEDYEWVDRYHSIKFDYIIFADVLEHLKNPYQVLLKSLNLLKEEGDVIISIPNISHNAIIMELMEGKFEYKHEGLLDDTHLRFFTRQSVLGLLDSVGLFPTNIQTTVLSPEQTEFKQDYRKFPEPVSTFLKDRQDGHVYQYIVSARKKSSLGNEQLNKKFDLIFDRYDTSKYLQIFWQEEDCKYFSEGASKRYTLQLNRETKIDIDIPSDVLKNRVRIDPVNCEAFIKIYKIKIMLKNGDVLHTYKTKEEISKLLVPIHDLLVNYVQENENGLEFLSIGRDPQLQVNGLEKYSDYNQDIIISIEIKIDEDYKKYLISCWEKLYQHNCFLQKMVGNN